MFGLKKMGKKVYKVGIKKAGKKAIKLVVKAPSAPLSIAVSALESTVKLTTGSDKLARKTALVGQVLICAPLGPLAMAGGVARWKLDEVVNRL